MIMDIFKTDYVFCSGQFTLSHLKRPTQSAQLTITAIYRFVLQLQRKKIVLLMLQANDSLRMNVRDQTALDIFVANYIFLHNESIAILSARSTIDINECHGSKTTARYMYIFTM